MAAAGEAYVPSILLLAACDACSICIRMLLMCGCVELSPYCVLQPVAPMPEPGLPQMTRSVDLCSWARKVADTLHAVYPLYC